MLILLNLLKAQKNPQKNIDIAGKTIFTFPKYQHNEIFDK